MEQQSITLTPSQEASLDRLNALYGRLDIWMANLYHHEDGGFFMTMSGKNDPEMECGLEMTGFTLSGIMTYTDAWEKMPAAVMTRFQNYFLSMQDPETGLFIDRQGKVNDRETARNQACVLGWLKRWDLAPKYPHPQLEAAAGNATDANNTKVLPEYMATVGSYIDWVASWNWDKNSWTGGDQAQSSLQYVNCLGEEDFARYKAALLDWLEKRQFPNGLWSPNLDFNAVSGAFKVGLIYNALGEKLPHPETILDTTVYAMQNLTPEVAHFVRNPLSLLGQLASYSPELKAKVTKAVSENLDAICGWVGQFLESDGGFSMRKGRSMRAFGGICSSHEVAEGDIDSTLMLLIARKSVYNLLGMEMPRLHYHDDFWKWIDGSLPTPAL